MRKAYKRKVNESGPISTRFLQSTIDDFEICSDNAQDLVIDLFTYARRTNSVTASLSGLSILNWALTQRDRGIPR